MQRWTSDPLPVPRHEAPFAEAKLEFEDLQHEGPSFTVYLYFDNPEVDAEAGEEGDGFIGRMFLFGHGDCWGGEGHCDVPQGPMHEFDTRPPHPLTPINLAVDCTDALQRLSDTEQTTVTALAYSFEPEKKEDVLKFSRLTLVTYD
jgi:hypothetical protein